MVVSTVVVVSMGEVSLVAVSAGEAFVAAVSTGEAFVAAVSTGEASVVAALVAVSVQCEADTCSAAAVSTGVAFVVVVLVAATSVAIFAITDFLMMSSSATSAFRGGGAIRTDITVTTRTITMDTATMGTAGTGTTVAPGMVTTMAPVMDTATAAEPVMDIAMAAEQGVCGGGNKRAPRLLEFALLLVRLDTFAPMHSGSEDARRQLLV